MNHAQLAVTVLDNLNFYLILYLALLLGYLVLYRKIYWGIFDPMIWTVTSMAGGAFCVCFLYFQDQLAPLYKWSFLTTEIALFLGLYLSRYIPVIKFGAIFQSEPLEYHENEITEFDIFTWIIGIAYILCEIVSIMTIGIVLFEEDVTHLSAFENHGILMAFITSFRLLCPLVLFYKILVRKQKYNYFDIVCWFFVAIGILTTGSKGAILVFVFQYFMIQLPLIYQGKAKPIKISWPLILGLASFPVLVVSITRGGDAVDAVTGVFIRLLASGDVFLLGYNDAVMNSIKEKSFLKYLFYPGWGTILKNLGFNISPPDVIGTDIQNFHYGKTDGGPNSRYNYVALHFLGFWGAIIYSGFIGTAIGVVRNTFRNLDVSRINYFGYLFLTLIAYLSNLLIDDSIVFANYIFWRLFFLVICYILTKTVFLIIRYRVATVSST
ncbi:hypothetical protein [Dyadobacter sp. CY356]|uniref:hypothetical protein n=1 Tax=Dyadobacter sp. CY356 TaxID=2906442 RepID=UPI001F413B23|nr:hypothetical protein [Dyadobacter sp. CY356]MCF0058313.1 hypothetical protein [Dyadobacter sp. CY356]